MSPSQMRRHTRRMLLLALSLPLLIGTQIATSGLAEACACCGSQQVVNVAEWDVLNMRAGPGTSYEIVGQLAPGTSCIVKTRRCQGRWCFVQWGDEAGWVNTRYLAYVEPR